MGKGEEEEELKGERDKTREGCKARKEVYLTWKKTERTLTR